MFDGTDLRDIKDPLTSFDNLAFDVVKGVSHPPEIDGLGKEFHELVVAGAFETFEVLVEGYLKTLLTVSGFIFDCDGIADGFDFAFVVEMALVIKNCHIDASVCVTVVL